MNIRDRIIELRRVRAGELLPNPRNWRTHNDEQRAALAGVLAEIGYASALLARRRADGRLELIDGHLRASTTPGQLVPVLVLDVSEDEADKLLATFDPLTSMAGIDPEKFRDLHQRLNFGDPAVRSMLSGVEAAAKSDSSRGSDELEIPDGYQVLIECKNEQHQQEVYEQLVALRFDCRLLML